MELRRLIIVDEMLPHLDLIQQLTPSLTTADHQSLLEAMVPHR